MMTWKEIMTVQGRYDDLLREAEKDRLARQALAASDKRERWSWRALGWVASRMVAWGLRLQERYTAAVSEPALDRVAVRR